MAIPLANRSRQQAWRKRQARLLGLAAFVLNPAVWGRVYVLAPDAPMLVGAMNSSAFQVGLTVAPLLAGLLPTTVAPPVAVNVSTLVSVPPLSVGLLHDAVTPDGRVPPMPSVTVLV